MAGFDSRFESGTSQELADRIFRDAPIIILVLDLEGLVQHVNPFFERLTGYRADEVRGKDWCLTFIPARDRARIRALLRERVLGRRVAGTRNAILTRSGEERIIEWTDDSLRSDAGEPIGILAIGQDVTRRTVAERALRSSEERLRTLIAATPVGVAMLDRELRYIACSRRWRADYKLAGQELAGRHHYDVVADLPERWKAAHRECLGGASRSCPEERIERADGSVQFVRWAFEPWRDATGDVAGVIMFIEDITDTKRLERRLQHAQALARVGSWEYVPATGWAWCSDELYRILGLEPGSATSFEIYRARVHPDDRARLDTSYRRAIARHEAAELEHRVTTPAGRLKYVRLQVKPLPKRPGQPARFEGTLQDISEQSGARLRLRNILDGMFAFVGLYDLEGRLIEANRAPLERAGLTREEVIGEPFWRTYWRSHSREAQERIRATLARAAAGDVVRDDFRVQIADGQLITLDAMFGPLRDAKGRVEAVVGSAVDVTERKQMEEELRRAQAFMIRAERLAKLGSWSWNIDTGAVVWSPEMYRQYGLDPEQVPTPSFELALAWVHPEDAPSVLESINRAVTTGTLTPVEYRARSGCGETRLVRIEGKVEETADGRVMFGFVQDISERRHAEAELQTHSQVLMSIGEGVLFIDSAGVIRFANPAFERMFGYDAGELVGQHVTALNDADELENARMVQEIMSAIDARGFWEGEIRNRRKDGGVFYTHAHITAIHAPHGLSWVSIQKDITERRRAEERVQASLREKETLLREVHHRVKNNLQIILSLLFFEGRKHGDETTFEELRQRITAMTLIHERLYGAQDVTQIDFGDYVRALVNELKRSMRPGPGIQITVATDDLRLPIETALPGGMIVCELVTNALKYAWPEASVGRASLCARARTGRIVLTVQDDGVGFPKDFDPLRTESFGWTLIKRLVDQLEGELELRAGRGARVRVSFPAPRPWEGKG